MGIRRIFILNGKVHPSVKRKANAVNNTGNDLIFMGAGMNMRGFDRDCYGGIVVNEIEPQDKRCSL